MIRSSAVNCQIDSLLSCFLDLKKKYSKTTTNNVYILKKLENTKTKIFRNGCSCETELPAKEGQTLLFASCARQSLRTCQADAPGSPSRGPGTLRAEAHFSQFLFCSGGCFIVFSSLWKSLLSSASRRSPLSINREGNRFLSSGALEWSAGSHRAYRRWREGRKHVPICASAGWETINQWRVAKWGQVDVTAFKAKSPCAASRICQDFYHLPQRLFFPHLYTA